MSKITVEQITDAARAACNSFPYFKHGFSATPPNELTADLEAAIKVNACLPDCFDSVTCDTSDNIVGEFHFHGMVKNSKGTDVAVDLYVNRYDVHIRENPDVFVALLGLLRNRKD
jgi:hypothetical protein